MHFWPKTGVPEKNSDRKCLWPYLIDQHLLSPVLGQKQPGVPNYSDTLFSFQPFLAIMCSVFGHFMFLSGGLLDSANSLRLHYARLFLDPRFLLFVLQNIAGYKNAVKCLLQQNGAIWPISSSYQRL